MRTQSIARRLGAALTLAAAAVAATTMAAIAGANDRTPVTEPFNGPVIASPTKHVLTGATVHTRPGQSMDNATVVIADGRITAVHAGPPSDAERKGAQVHDYTDHHLYAGFIDAWVEVNAPKPDANSSGAHWCPRVTPQRDALDGDALGDDLAKSLRELGFAAAAISPEKGVFRGTGAVVSTADDFEQTGQGETPVYKANAFHALGFDRSGWAEATYPTSVPGVMALMRQSLSDADWQAANADSQPNCLDTLSDTSTPLFFDTTNELMALLAHDVVTEAKRTAVIVGCGDEFRRLDAMAKTGHAFVLPLRFPKKPDVTSPGKADAVDLTELMRWEQAPTNARRMVNKGANVSLTSSKVTKRGEFHKNLAKAVNHGLTDAQALAALTTTPAQLLGVTDRLGTIENGKLASLVVSKAPLGDKAFKPTDLWIDGRRHEISKPKSDTFDGTWTIKVVDGDFEMRAKIDADSITNIEGEGDDIAESKGRNVEMVGNRLSWIVDDEDDGTGSYLMTGTLVGDTMTGLGVAPDQSTFAWTATKTAQPEAKDDDKKDEADTPNVPENFGAPFGPYARAALPSQETIVVNGATIWTSGPDGIIDNGILIVSDGKIVHVGKALDPAAPAIPNGARVIDAQGKHVTPGLIDAHSHTGLFRFGVNESGQAVTSEVRIADSIDPSHINWYRQLAGGVTSVNSLHGSANPIGGQNAISKVRWGAHTPEQMRFKGAKPGIKFALGENVKQSNWGDNNTTRYPQTRMGVETIIRDRFTAADHYLKAWIAGFDNPPHGLDDYGFGRAHSWSEMDDPQWDIFQQIWNLPSSTTQGVAPRKDLELEALAEILAGRRLIHCHSYRQDEILMLCRVAEDFGFKIGTFQHGLEVYKVAEAVREHAIGASLFSDWWAYKVEVQDAIPYAGPIQSEAGVLTSYNSDDDGLARRMNGEAAKAHKYGATATANGIDPSDALKFVTLNPAIQLGIGDRVGSLETGKDADFAIWSGDPLSAFSRCEATFIDGAQYFSLEQDKIDRELIARERARIIAKLIANKDKKKGDKDSEDDDQDQEPEGESTELDDPGEGLHRYARAAVREHFLSQLRAGKDPTLPSCGDCGCGFIHLNAQFNR